jgi:agmatine/peptidylarginine deiminase
MKRQVTLLVLILLLIGSLSAERIRLSPEQNTLHLLHSTPQETVLQYNISQFDTRTVNISGQSWYHITLPDEGITQQKGLPELPVFNRSIIIDDIASYQVEVYDLEYTEIKLPIAPSKGVITRDIDPRTVPYTFDQVYQSGSFYPAQIAELSEPYILRDFRGITIRTIPFAYKADNQTLRIYTAYKVRVYADGESQVNRFERSRASISQEFAPLYAKHFVNWGDYRYLPVNDNFGKLLVISHSNFMTAIQPYVNWKRQKGIETELIEWSTIGSTATQLQSYIQNRYNADNSITYIQLVGDAPQIPSLSHNGGGSDPSFSLVAGSDYYPDIFIGRFSAESVTQLTPQINRSIAYERDANTGDTWLGKATGIASAEGGGSQGDNGESDIQHMNNIRNDLLGYGYSTVDQIYDPGASAATVSTNVNTGRGFSNYVGHGSNTTWGTTGFSLTDAMALSNGNKAPFIVDVACVNGNFVDMTCFAEGWMRNPNGGAITIYASTINQSWNSPMRGQDEITDLWVAESKSTAGGLYYNGSCKMMDIYGNTAYSDGVDMFKTWHIFGDASLMARSKTPLPMTVTHPAQIIIGASAMSVTTGVANALVSLTYDHQIYARGFTDSSGNLTLALDDMPAGSVNFSLTVTAHNRVTYIGEVQQIPGTGPYVVVANTEYSDSNNDSPEYSDNASFSITFENIGAAAAHDLSASLSCNTDGITITDADEAVGNLDAGASITRSHAFGFNIANDISDGTVAAFTIFMTSGEDTWTHEFNLTINAPELAFGIFTIADPGGNNNGQLDPGETVSITMPIQNLGAALSPSGSADLSSSTPGITINTSSVDFPAISASGNRNLTFGITADTSITQGTLANLSFSAIAGAYLASETIQIEVGAPDEIIIGQGTATQSYPLDRYYNYCGHEAIYLASEIATQGSISSIGYYKDSGTDTNPINAVSIYMKHTTASTLSTGTYSIAGYTLVYSGSFTNNASSGWMEVELDTRFEYNGVANLSILVIKGYQSWINTYPRWTYTSASNRARQYHSDSAQPTSLTASSNLPNVKLAIYNASMDNALISVSPTSVSENVSSGDSVSRQITVSNTGTAELIWSIPQRDIAARDMTGSTFSSDVDSYTPGSTATWIFTTTNNSTDAEWIKDIEITFPSTITVNSVSSFSGGSNALSPAPESGTGVTINWHYEDSNSWGGITSGQTASATVNVSISASASGNLTLPWVITGDGWGSDPHIISGSFVFTQNGDPHPEDWYTISTHGGTIAPGENTTISLTLNSEGLEDGTHISSITINSNAQNNPALTVPLRLTVETQVDPFPSNPRFVAEWEPAKGAVVSYAGGWGQPYALLRDLASESLLYVIVSSSQQYSAQNSLQTNAVNLDNVRYLNASVDSYWVRDYGPWTIFDDNAQMHLVDFNYNRPRPNDNAIPAFIADQMSWDSYDLDMNHTGGNIMTDGMGKAMSTELVLSENNSLTPAQIDQRFGDILGVTDYQIYTDPINTYIDHIDCWAKLLDVDKVLIRRVPTTHAQYAAIEASVSQWQSKTSSYGTPYRIFRVDTPNNEPYTNSFILNQTIYVPQMGTANDAAALAVYQDAMPGYTINGYTHPSYQSTDALHCRINTIFDSQMIAIKHLPPASLTEHQLHDFEITISHHHPLLPDASYISWSTSETGPWQISYLTQEMADTYTASIPAPAYGQYLYYWIQAEDSSGRLRSLPLCAEADPFVIQVDTMNPLLPDWTPVSYDNPPALIHAEVNVMGDLAQEGDLVGAFVAGECRGTALISESRAMLSIIVQLAAPHESVSFRVFSQADGVVYDADVVVTPNYGEIIGADEPIDIICTLDKPVLSIAIGESGLTLDWDIVQNASFYRILSADSPQGEFSLLAETEDSSYAVPSENLRAFFKIIAVKDDLSRRK